MHHTHRLIRLVLIAALTVGPAGCDKKNSGGSAAVGTPGTPVNPVAGLPAGWEGGDIGAVGQPGSSTGSGGTFSVSGSGTDIWDAADAFHFVRRPLVGDGEIVARVVSLDPTDAWAKAGVMIRETLAADSRFAMTVVTPSNGTTLQVRPAAGGGCSLQWGPAHGAPYWVKITRTGDVFTGSASGDGASWTTIGSSTITMGLSVHIGLCVTAHNNAAKAPATFDSVTLGSAPPGGSISISTPVSRIIYQRNNSNQAFVPLRGACSGSVTGVEARAVARAAGQGTTTGWTLVDGAPSGGTYRGSLTVQGGWYSVEVRGLSGGTPVATATVDRVGVGEVFVVVGHSVAQGQGINIEGSTDERAATIPDNRTTDEHNLYNDTAAPQYLPPVIFSSYSTGVIASPFGAGTYFWAKFAQYVVQSQNVPVLLYNAAFGGTSLEHWYKSSQGIPFVHSFVNGNIRMPYINLYNTLRYYINRTGIRGVLSDQGANDWPNPDSNQVFEYYKTWVLQARADLGYGALAIVVNRQTPAGNTGIRVAQQRMMNEVPNCFNGPDYDTLAPEDRYDGTHMSEQGCWTAAQRWADAVNGGFFGASQPYLPTFP